MRLVRTGALALMGMGMVLGLASCSDDDSGDGCPQWQQLCGIRCVNIMTDMTNCGGCDVICNVGQSCVEGVCSLGCTGDTLECDGACVDPLSDRNHCGDCETVCGADQVCLNGTCAGCQVGYGVCDGACVDLQDDAAHCGDCETACAVTENCVAGDCGCGDLVYSDTTDCLTCVEGSCCDELTACTSGTDCQLLVACRQACGYDVSCKAGCDTDYPDGLAEANALDDCANLGCETECTLSGICGTELSYQSDVMTECVTDNCCASYLPCYGDTACQTCMGSSTGTGCDTNSLFTDYQDCLATYCPSGICTTPVGYVSNGDPLFNCNICLGDNCCGDMQTCVGDESQPAVDLCIECLIDYTSVTCTDATVAAAAQDFLTCQAANCSAECTAP